MDTERRLLFGVVALQNGVLDADRLGETWSVWVRQPAHELADEMIDRGWMTIEQRTELERVVERALDAHGGDFRATLAATVDGRSLDAIRRIVLSSTLGGNLSVPVAQVVHQVLEKLSDGESRDRYTLTHLHARGGMGQVWLARDGALGREIALKELRPEQMDHPTVYSRFIHEAKVTAQLEHPGIVPVYELGSDGHAPYYTMRFVRGKTLSEAIRHYHRERVAGAADSVTAVKLLTAFVGVCHAVAYAHSRGVIHRDLKGQNVVLGDFGEVMVLDWGLAKKLGPNRLAMESFSSGRVENERSPLATTLASEVDPEPRAASEGTTVVIPSANTRFDEQGREPGAFAVGSSGLQPTQPESGAGVEGTVQGQLLGTPAYMAPEQAEGRHDLVDQRTDVYGLGAILYEILTGQPPFMASKTSEVIRRVCQDAPAPPRQIAPAAPAALEAVCLKAIAKPRAGRYQTVLELAQEVERFLADEPVRAYSEPWLRRAARWGRRHRTAVAGGLGLLFTGIFALAVSTVLIAHERNEAETQGRQAREAVHLLARGSEIGFDEELDPQQRAFLDLALNYFEKYTIRVAQDASVRLEHGKARMQMGDILRKLGRPDESEQAYRKAIELLDPLSSSNLEATRGLARTRTLLADLLIRSGRDRGHARPLYDEAIRLQTGLTSGTEPAAFDLLRLGQSQKSLADLMRLEGQFTEAGTVYNQAIATIEKAQVSKPRQGEPEVGQGEILNELALTLDARGWIGTELGRADAAAKDYKAAISLLEKLVAQFPTVPRHRKVLAKAYNSLALIESSTRRLDEAEANYHRELPLVERLTQDYPDRPEYQRELARTLMNLGNLMLERNAAGDAQAILTRAVEINKRIHEKNPLDTQCQLDLAKCWHNLGNYQHLHGASKEAVASLQAAMALSEPLVEQHPEKPRYAESLAMTLVNLGVTYRQIAPGKAAPTLERARKLAQKLVDQYPQNVNYQILLVSVLRNYGVEIAAAGQHEQALKIYDRALALLGHESKEEQERSLNRADILNNKGELLRELKSPETLTNLESAERIYKTLAAAPAAASEAHHRLAIAQYNIGEYLTAEKRFDTAEPYLKKAVAGFEALVAGNRRSIELETHFGQVLGTYAELLHRVGKLEQARDTLNRALEHQRLAVRLSRGWDSARKLLGEHLLELASVQLELSAYQAASAIALELPSAVPASARTTACLESARFLARLVRKVDQDPRISTGEKEALIRGPIARIVILIREAIDANPKLIKQVKADPDFKTLESYPEFQTIMNTLVSIQ